MTDAAWRPVHPASLSPMQVALVGVAVACGHPDPTSVVRRIQPALILTEAVLEQLIEEWRGATS